jgi:hypothetical protein
MTNFTPTTPTNPIQAPGGARTGRVLTWNKPSISELPTGHTMGAIGSNDGAPGGVPMFSGSSIPAIAVPPQHGKTAVHRGVGRSFRILFRQLMPVSDFRVRLANEPGS